MPFVNFGIPTLIELRTLESCALLCRESGLSFIELNMNLPQYQTDMINVSQFLEIAEKYRIYYTIHLDENLNPCDFNNSVAEAYTETMLQAIDIAKQLLCTLPKEYILRCRIEERFCLMNIRGRIYKD